MKEKKKMGRPTDNPKIYKITVRINAKANDVLNEYCVKCNKTRADAVRDAIFLLEKK